MFYTAKAKHFPKHRGQRSATEQQCCGYMGFIFVLKDGSLKRFTDSPLLPAHCSREGSLRALRAFDKFSAFWEGCDGAEVSQGRLRLSRDTQAERETEQWGAQSPFDPVILIWNNRQHRSVQPYLPHYRSKLQTVGTLRCLEKISPYRPKCLQTCTEWNKECRGAAVGVRSRPQVCSQLLTHRPTRVCALTYPSAYPTGKHNGMSVFIRSGAPWCGESSECARVFDQPLYKEI